jgi:acetyl/propionyl-CoA carboxylase alpha subunit
MRRAIDEYRVHGVVTNLPFHRWLLRHPRFVAGDLDTNFIAEEFTGLPPAEQIDGYEAALAAAFFAKRAEARGGRQRPAPEPTISGWRAVARRKMLRG